MSSSGKLALSIKERRAFTPFDQTLLDILYTKANWVWTSVSSGSPPGPRPSEAVGERSAFRTMFPYPADKGRPTKAKLMIAADDYMALYVDGVMVQSADIDHDWTDPYSFQVPLPVVQNHTASSLLLGVRVINRSGSEVGLIVAAQVDYESGDPDVFYTGLDDSWRGQKVYDEGWEQPWFNSDSWDRVTIIPQNVRSPSQSLRSPTDVAIFDSLPADATPGTCSSTLGSCNRDSIGLSPGAFAGVLIGSVLAALVVGALGCYIVLRRWYGGAEDLSRSLEADGDGAIVPTPPPMLEGPNLPQEPQPSPPSRPDSYEEYRPMPTISSQQTPNPSINDMFPSLDIRPAADLAPPMYSESSVTTGERSNVKSTHSSTA